MVTFGAVGPEVCRETIINFELEQRMSHSDGADNQNTI